MEAEGQPVQPMIDLVVGLIRDGKNGEEAAVFHPDAKAYLSEALDTYKASITLPIVVQRLMSMAFDLEKEDRSPKAAQLIAAVVERPEIVARLRVVTTESRAEGMRSRLSIVTKRGEATSRQFARFEAANDAKVAPSEESAPPRGSVKLGHLRPRRRFQ